MSVVDLHPEDLLDKDATGDLDAAERARLDAHLARCTPCRLERKLRADFRAELSAELPAQSFGLVAGDTLVPGDALPDVRVSRVSLREGEGAPPSTRRPSVWLRRRRARAAWLFAAAALLAGSAAAAMGLSDGEWPRRMVRSTPIPAAVDVAPPEPPRAKVHHAVPAPLPVLPAPVVSAPETPEPIAAPVAPPRAAVPVTRPLAIAAPPPPVGPAELLDSESRARREGDYGRALDIHRDLESRYPTSREAQVSRAVVGRLFLDRGDAAGALANFDSYLAAGMGDLREEAMVGRATALERAGRGDDAARAWSDLLTAFPETPYAQHARARCEGLNGRPNGP